MYAPVALFVYNRPAHTRATVEALLGNRLAGLTDLHVFSDAPKKPEAQPQKIPVATGPKRE